MPVLGIDVSHFQGEVDWDAVARSEMKFAFVKASEGNTMVDSRFQRNWTACQDAGLLHGAYHFARPGSDPEAQAAHFASVVGPPAWSELPPVLDLESTGGLTVEGVLAWARAFLKKADDLFGRQVIVYTGGLWRRTLGNPDAPDIGARPLWTARYGAKEPVLPRPWQRWDFWQFTDGQSGQVVDVPGVRGPCDCNRFRGTLDELKALAGHAQVPAVDVDAAAPSAVPGATVTPAWPGRFFTWPRVSAVRGEDVQAWQRRMLDRDFVLDADGAYGPESKRACIAFQRALGLEPDGIVGRSTWDATFADGG